MNKYDKKEFILEDNNKYILVSSVYLDGSNYGYFVNKDKMSDSFYGEILESESGLTISNIEPNIFSEKVLPAFINSVKN